MQSSSPQPASPGTSLRRHWVILLLTTVVFGLGGAAYAVLAPKTYVAHATALIRPLTGNAFSTAATTNPQNATVAIQTEGQLVNSAPVAHAVDKQVGRSRCVAANATTSVLVNTQLLQISYTTKNARTAQLCANAFVKQYLNFRQTLAEQTIASELSRLENDAQSTSRQLAAATTNAKSANPAPDAAANVRLYSTRLSALEAQIGTTRGESTQPGSIVVTAVVPQKPSGIKPWMIIAAAIALGLVVGAGLAVWRGARERRRAAKHPAEIEGLPVLASLAGRPDGPVATPIPPADSDTEFSQASLAVLANIGDRHVIAVAPVATLGSVAAVSYRLARGIADAGYRVVLIDASSDSPSVADVVDLDPRPGFAELLAGADLATISLTDVAGVEVLSAGMPGQARRDVGAPLRRLRDIVEELCEVTDFVVINASSLASPSGLRQLLWSDAAILTVADTKVMSVEVEELTRRTEHMKVDLLGVIAVRPTKNAGGKRPAEKSAARSAGKSAEAVAAPEKSAPEPASAKDGWVPGAEDEDPAREERADDTRQTAAPSDDRSSAGSAPSSTSSSSADSSQLSTPSEARDHARESRSGGAADARSRRPGARNRVQRGR